MPCWPDLWDRIKHFLPVVSVFASVLGYFALVALLLWALKLRKRWMRIVSRVIGVVAALVALPGLLAIMFGLALASGNPPTQTRIVRSHSGREARLHHDGGFLGRDYTEVELTRRDTCGHIKVFWHAGPSYFDDVKIEWMDDRHLQLTYHVRPGDPTHCEQQVGEVTIACTSMGWAN